MKNLTEWNLKNNLKCDNSSDKTLFEHCKHSHQDKNIPETCHCLDLSGYKVV